MSKVNNPIDIAQLTADIVNQVNSNTDARTIETKADVATKATATQTVVAADGDVTQSQLDSNVTAINANTDAESLLAKNHVTAESDRILANIPEPLGFAPVVNLPLNTNGLSDNGSNIYPALHITDNPDKLASGGDMESLAPFISRTGKGFVTFISIAESIGFRLFVDGKLFINREHENKITTTVTSQIVGQTDSDTGYVGGLPYIEYKQSLVIYTSKPLAATSSSSNRFTLRHIITE